MDYIKNILKAFTEAGGVSGDEFEIAQIAAAELSKYADVKIDALGNIIGEVSSKGDRHILLDAHMDRIGFIVTAIDSSGFLRIAGVGGNDLRILAAAEVTVHGKKPLYGIITSTPPHLSSGEDRDAKAIDELGVDVGLPYEKVKELVSVGDRVTINSKFCELKNQRVSAAALDDRVGMTVILRALQILELEQHSYKISVLFSSREEVGGQGAEVAAFSLTPDEAIAVDVSFASAPGVAEHKSSPLGEGVIIGYAPVLSFSMADRLRDIAKAESIPFSVEVGGRGSGSNADSIITAGSGVETAVLFIPQRNMHSAVEVIDMQDVESAAKLIAAYILRTGGEKDYA